MSGHKPLEWKLDANQVLPPGYEERDIAEAMPFELAFHNMHPSPSSFADFDTSRKVPVTFQGLLQLFVHAINRIDAYYTTLTDKSALRSDAHMISMYVETLLWDPDAERPENANVRERAFVSEQLTRMYRDKALFEGVSEQIVSARVRALRFMEGLLDREAYGVRLWFVSHDSNVSIAKYMADLLLENFARSQKDVDHDGPRIEDRAFQARVRLTGDTDGGDVTAITGPNEVFRRITSMFDWAILAGMYTGKEKLALDTFYRTKAIQAREAFNTARHLLNPACVFDCKAYFERIKNNASIDRRQRDIAFYRRNGKTLRFPHPSAVVLVDPSHMSVEQFSRLLLPTYQLFMVEPAKDGALAHSIALARAHNAAQATLAREQNRELDPRALVNAVGRIDAARADDDDDEDDDDDDDALFFESPEEAERARNNGGGGGGGLRADEDGDDVPARAAHDDPERLEAMLGTIDQRPVTQQRLEQKFKEVQVGSGAQKQETHLLRDRFMGKVLPAIRSMASRDERRRALVQMRQLAVREYVAKCSSPSSDISDPSRAIAQWAINMRAQGENALKFRGDYRARDPSLSFFGNFMTIMWQRMETCLAAYTAHSTFWLVFVSSLTSFRYRLGLHGNLVIHGQPGTSKSWPLEQLVRLMIKGTYDVLTSMTERASDVDGNDNDKTVLFHEAPYGMITGGSGTGKQNGGKGGGGGGGAGASSACDAMKDMMTGGVRSRAICASSGAAGAQGVRTTRIVISEHQKSFILCTNAKGSEIDSAFRSRCIMLYLVRRERADGVSSEDRQAEEPEIDRSSNSEFDKYAHDMKMLQMGVHDIEKLIKTGALPEPTLGVLPEVYKTYKKTLLDKFGIMLDRRQYEKVCVHVRQHVVLSALVWLYLTPVTPCYGRTYAIEHLLLLAPMLKDSVEIVFFVLDLLRHEFIPPTQRAVRAALRQEVAPKLFEKQRKAARKEFGVAAHDKQRVLPLKMFQPTLGSSRDRAFNAFQRTLSFAGAPPPSARGGGGGTQVSSIRTPEQRMAQGALPRGSGAAAGDGGGGGSTAVSAIERALQADGYDPNYVHFGCNLWDAAKLIAADTDCLPEFSAPLAIDEVKEELMDMTRRRVFAPEYRMNENGDVCPPVRRVSDKVHACSAAKRVGPNHEFCIHSDLIFGPNSDPHEEAIRSCLSAYEEPARYVAGRPPRESMPFLLNVRDIEPQRGTYENRHERGARKDKIAMVGTTLDKMCTGMHLRKQSMLDNSANRARYDSVCLSRVAFERHKFVAERQISYPLDCIAEAKQRLTAKRRARDFNARATQRDVLDRTRTGEVQLTGLPEDDDNDGDDVSESFGGAANDYLDVERSMVKRVTSAAVNQTSTFDAKKPIEAYLEPERDHRGCEIDEFGEFFKPPPPPPAQRQTLSKKRARHEYDASASDDGEFFEAQTNHGVVQEPRNAPLDDDDADDDDDDDDVDDLVARIALKRRATQSVRPESLFSAVTRANPTE